MLFEKLQQGCTENEELLSLALARAEAESAFGNKLLELKTSHAPKKDGFGHDEGATVRKAYEGIINEMAEEGKHHLQVAQSIRVMVLTPFNKWTEQHRARVEYSADFLREKVKVFDHEGAESEKAKKKYDAKCRALDKAKEVEKEKAQEATPPPAAAAAPAKNKGKEVTEPAPSTSLKRAESVVYDDQSLETIVLGGDTYNPLRLKSLLRKMLQEIPQTEVKVPIMGVYERVSTGADIVAWLQKFATGQNLGTAEQFGQDLISNSYLRLVGQVGSKFLNSTQLHYQWKKLAFVHAGLEKAVPREQSIASTLVEGYLGSFNNYLNQPDSSAAKLQKEVEELDEQYKQSVVRFDDARCLLEESIIEHVSFMQRCETDRLKALKHVLLDFLAPISNNMPSKQASVDKYLVFQESVKPEGDLVQLLENYKTGGFAPKAPVYDNYYNNAEGWTFGVDLEIRARGDGKRIPLIVSSILKYFDNQYPVLENDKVRLGVWINNAPLKAVHALRKQLNTGKPISDELLAKHDPTVVASTLKLYLQELPDSIVPVQFYDVFKAIYKEHGQDEDPKARLDKIQQTCSTLRVSQVAVIDALTKHFGRLLEIAEPSKEDRGRLYAALGPSVIRPRVQTGITLGDKHPQQLVADLIEQRKAILAELKRSTSGAVGSRNPSAKVAGGASVTTATEETVPVTERRPVEDSALGSLDAQDLKVRPAEAAVQVPVEVPGESAEASGEPSEAVPEAEAGVEVLEEVVTEGSTVEEKETPQA